MKIITTFLDSLRFVLQNKLTTALELCKNIKLILQYDFPVIYLETKNVYEVALMGINEITKNLYVNVANNKRMVFVYRNNNNIEKWVITTSLNKYITTAVVPA